MNSSDRVGAAYHEAGHAVVAWALGLPVGDIAIAVGGDDAAGRSNIGVADRLSIRDQIAVCVAGLVAQEIFNVPTHDHAGLADYGRAIGILDEMPEHKQREVIDDAHKRAREIILANRARVARVARHLIAKGNITGGEFASDMSAAAEID